MAVPSWRGVSKGEMRGRGRGSYGLRSVGAAVVDELDDGVGVVDEVGRESRVGEGVAVVGDGFSEVVGDLLSFGVAHAAGIAVGEPAWALENSPRGCEGGGGEEGGRSQKRGEGTHLGEDDDGG